MFSTAYDGVRRAVTAALQRPCTNEACLPDDPLDILRRCDFGSGGSLDAAILHRAQSDRESRHNGDVYAVVPLYVTSICRERCLYCNYRAVNIPDGVIRVRLTDEELIEEAECLIAKGFRAIELVYASDPRNGVDQMCRHASMVRERLEAAGGGIVGLNAEPQTESDYLRLRDAGVSFAVVWMETYDRERYAELHPGPTRKSNFDDRLDCYERMLNAGMPFGMGVLSGLAPWREDWAMLLEHERYLLDRYGAGAAILGIPRLKPAAGAAIQPGADAPSDAEFAALVGLHTIVRPDTRPFVSTRENWDLCVELARGGGCLFTFDCSTIPGGYSLGRSGNQFATQTYDVTTHAALLEKEGLNTRFVWSAAQ